MFNIFLMFDIFLMLMFRMLSLLEMPAAFLRHFIAHVMGYSSSELLIKTTSNNDSKVLEQINVYQLVSTLKV